MVIKKILPILIFAFPLSCYGSNEPFGSDILLVINYNHAHYESVSFLKELYSSCFPHIVFYGPEPTPDVIECSQHRGWYSYKSIADAMQRYPEFKGYLWVHDDCLIHFWKFYRFDKTKIWFTNVWKYADLQKGLEGAPFYGWWTAPCGFNAIKQTYDQLNDNYKAMLEKNCGKKMIPIGYSDIVYIPAHHRDAVIELCELFAHETVFLGIAVPTLCSILDKKEEWESLKGRAFWDKESNTAIVNYDQKFDFIHPIKFSDPKNREFVLEKFKLAQDDK